MHAILTAVEGCAQPIDSPAARDTGPRRRVETGGRATAGNLSFLPQTGDARPPRKTNDLGRSRDDDRGCRRIERYRPARLLRRTVQLQGQEQVVPAMRRHDAFTRFSEPRERAVSTI